MYFHNRFRGRQAHAGALDAISLRFPSIEFFEDAVEFPFFDSRPWSATLMSWNPPRSSVVILMGWPGEEYKCALMIR
jgi:hypothetical protein